MKARHHVLAVLALSLLLPLLFADQPAVKPLDKPITKPAVVPFELLKSGHMAVMIKVNGKGPYRVIFDTGAPITLLNNKLAKEAGLLKDAPQSLLPLFGNIAEVKVKELEVGSEKIVNQQAMVMDHPLVELMAKQLGPLYGIVGFPFFARYKMTIDYQAQTLTLVPSGYKPANVLRSLESTALQLMTASSQPPKVLSPAAQWGFVANKARDDAEAGVVVKEVLADSAAAQAGLKPGDRLLTVDGRWTDSLADLYEVTSLLKPGAAVSVRLKRDGKEQQLKVTPRPGL
jgi:hypothetical protein